MKLFRSADCTARWEPCDLSSQKPRGVWESLFQNLLLSSWLFSLNFLRAGVFYLWGWVFVLDTDAWCSVTHLNCPGFAGTLATLPVSFRSLPNWPAAVRAHPSFDVAHRPSLLLPRAGTSVFSFSAESVLSHTPQCRLRFLSGNLPYSWRQEKSLLQSAHVALFCSFSMCVWFSVSVLHGKLTENKEPVFYRATSPDLANSWLMSLVTSLRSVMLFGDQRKIRWIQSLNIWDFRGSYIWWTEDLALELTINQRQ